MNTNSQNIIVTGLITGFAIIILLFWMLADAPTNITVSPAVFYMQMVSILASIIIIPTSLKYVTRKRFPDDKTYFSMCIMRLAAIEFIGMIHILLFYYIQNMVSGLYMALIHLTAMFFCYPQRKNDF